MTLEYSFNLLTVKKSVVCIKKMQKLQYFVVYLSLCVLCESARILIVVPTPSISHQIPFRPLTLELARRGHQVTTITTDPIFPKGQTPENLTEIGLHDISYNLIREMVHESGVTTGKKDDMIRQMTQFQPMAGLLLEKHKASKEVQNVLENQKFDLLILEAVMRPFIVYAHILKVPVILASSFGAFNPTYEVVGAPIRPALLYPTLFRQRLFDLTLWEKINDLYVHYMLEYIFQRQVPEDNKTLKRLYGENTPSISELENNVDLLMVNVHPLWDQNRPVPPSVVYIGGIVQKPKKELPKDLKSYLDNSKHGVIYISYGTNVMPSLLPREKIQMLINVFSKLPYDVLWKWDTDELVGISKNVKMTKWVPQSDLLRHPKLKLFITQGGLQSTDEAIIAGVPLIGMPMLGDQWFNVEQYVRHKIGIRLDMEDLTEESFLNGINTVINDESYRLNIARLRELMYDQPQSALERAVWWTEHVLRHGGRHLRAPAANMSWAEYLDLELLAVAATAAIVSIAALATILYLLIRSLGSYFSIKDKKD